MLTTFCILSAAAMALCQLAAAQEPGSVVGAATIGTMEGTFTLPSEEWDGTSPPECTSVMAGCVGEFVEVSHATGGTVEVINDCTFRISSYSFDGEGPAVEWYVLLRAKRQPCPSCRRFTTDMLAIGMVHNPALVTPAALVTRRKTSLVVTDA